MRRQRVGTLSLGILLIVTGVVILAAQLKQRLIIDALFTFWPLILVIIGAEILWHIYTAKEQEPKVKYDVFSIFIIMAIVFFSIGVYALTATGVVEKISREANSGMISVDVPFQGLPVDEETKKIVIYAPNGRLNIKRSSSHGGLVFGRAVVYATDTEEADCLVEESPVVTHREGNVLFIQFPSDIRSGRINPGIRDMQHTLLIPADRDIEVEGDYFDISIDADMLRGNWLIRGNGTLNIMVDKEADILLRAQVNTQGRFKGNADWEIEEPADEPPNKMPVFKGYLKRGAGTNSIDIFIDNGEVIVNEL